MIRAKLFFLSAAVFLGVGLYSLASAATQDLTGYIYSENVGWISLSCQNNNSCNTVKYGVTADDNGFLCGYGFSQDGEWIKFDPKYGGVGTDSVGEISGWAFTDQRQWLRIDSVKIIAASVLKDDAASIKDAIVKSDNISTASLADSNFMDLLNKLCGQIFGSKKCSNIK